MNTDENKRLVTSALERLAEKCRLNRALTLTESDLKCQLYLELFQIPQFGTLNEIFDQGILGPSIHTETKFFDIHGDLRQAPDIVITTTNRLSIKTRLDGKVLPSKGFHFDGAALLIELKLLRTDRPLNNSKLIKIEEDILKGSTLNQRGDLDFHLFVVVFDRFNHGESKVHSLFDKYREQQNLTCKYYGGGPSFRP